MSKKPRAVSSFGRNNAWLSIVFGPLVAIAFFVSAPHARQPWVLVLIGVGALVLAAGSALLLRFRSRRSDRE